jgi:hypothetical protein
MRTKLNNRALARVFARSESYAGGYLYAGATRSHGLRGPLHFVNGYDRTPESVYTADNKRVLASLPVGATVSLSESLGSGEYGESWTKVAPCAWTLADRWEDPN